MAAKFLKKCQVGVALEGRYSNTAAENWNNKLTLLRVIVSIYGYLSDGSTIGLMEEFCSMTVLRKALDETPSALKVSVR